MATKPLTALVLEDVALIALGLEDALDAVGFDVVILPTCAAANAWLVSTPPPDVAVLDVMLADGKCVAEAQMLKEMGVPFIVCSASMEERSDPIFDGVPWMEKPCSDVMVANMALHLATRSPIDPDAALPE